MEGQLRIPGVYESAIQDPEEALKEKVAKRLALAELSLRQSVEFPDDIYEYLVRQSDNDGNGVGPYNPLF